MCAVKSEPPPPTVREMEGKEYPTRSKSGVRKVRTPWDNSSSLLFDELVAGKRSPKPPTPGGKGGGTPKQSPKNGGKKTSSKSPANFKSPGTPKEKVSWRERYMYVYVYERGSVNCVSTCTCT